MRRMPDRPTLTWTGKRRPMPVSDISLERLGTHGDVATSTLPGASRHTSQHASACADISADVGADVGADMGADMGAATSADMGNALIQGDNLAVLTHLADSLRGEVKCICIDPPYNTGRDFESYDDARDHSDWLSDMQASLTLMRDALRQDGSVWILLDDREVHYMKVLGDMVFGRRNFIANVVRESRTSRENRRVFSVNHEHVLVFARDRASFEKARNLLPLGEDARARYRNPDNDHRGPWLSVPARAPAGHGREGQFYTLVTPGGIRHELVDGDCWRYTEARMQAAIADGRIWFGVKGTASPRIKRFLHEADKAQAGLVPETLWPATECGTGASAMQHLQTLLERREPFPTPKPEALIGRIVELASNPGELVLDAYVGSGTTSAVAHKLGRRWIGIDASDSLLDCARRRLAKVIDGDDAGGITARSGWTGGGGFTVYRS